VIEDPELPIADARRRKDKRLAVLRVETGEDVANAVLFLVSEEAGFVTGDVLGVTGGWLSEWRSFVAAVPRIDPNSREREVVRLPASRAGRSRSRCPSADLARRFPHNCRFSSLERCSSHRRTHAIRRRFDENVRLSHLQYR